jgi:hypothetical protein
LLLGAAAYLFTSVPVQVATEPDAERVSFEGGGPDLRVGSSHLLRTGKYTLVAEHKGYETLHQPMTVTATRRSTTRSNFSRCRAGCASSCRCRAKCESPARPPARRPVSFR